MGRVAQFDLHRLDDGTLVVDLQSDLIGINETRIAAPLRSASDHAGLPKLNPAVVWDGERHYVRVQELGSIPSAAMGTKVGDLSSERDALKRALDILIDGF